MPPGLKVLARLLQHGETGEWQATDGESNPLTIRKGHDGALEIVHYPNGEEPEEMSDADPGGKLAMTLPPGAQRSAARDAAALRRLQAGQRLEQHELYAANRAFAANVSAYYSRDKK